MKKYGGFLNNGLSYWVGRLEELYSAFYLVYTSPVDRSPQAEEGMQRKLMADGLMRRLLNSGKEREKMRFDPVVKGAFAV